MSRTDHDVTVEEPPVSGGPPETAAPRRRRGGLAAAGAGLLLAGLVGGLALSGLLPDGADEADEPRSAPQVDDTRTSPPATWLSGATGEDVVSGEFGDWRGRPVDLAVAFADDNERMVELPALQPGEEYGDWDRDLDLAVGAFGEDESWEDAAAGEYDDRWRESLENLAALWEDREGTLYLRFAHEMNGTWYPWSVGEDDVEDFKAAWQRYRALQQEILPESQLVFNVAKRSSDTGVDWTETFPGAEHVDVMGVDYYNQSPHVETQDEWDEAVVERGEFDEPVGLLRHLEFAEEVGLPLSVSEWNNNADLGDSPVYVENMHAFFAEHGGTGPGQLLYEAVFNRDKEDGKWLLHATDGAEVRMPESAEAYQEAF